MNRRIPQADIERSENCYADLQRHLNQDKSKIKKKEDEINEQILSIYPQFERAKILKDHDGILQSGTQLQRQYYDRSQLHADHFSEGEQIRARLESVNLPHINGFCSDLLTLIRDIMREMTFEVLGKRMIMKEVGKRVIDVPLYKVSTNIPAIHECIDGLIAGYKEVRKQIHVRLREISDFFEKLQNDIPREFPSVVLEDIGQNEFSSMKEMYEDLNKLDTTTPQQWLSFAPSPKNPSAGYAKKLEMAEFIKTMTGQEIAVDTPTIKGGRS